VATTVPSEGAIPVMFTGGNVAEWLDDLGPPSATGSSKKRNMEMATDAIHGQDSSQQGAQRPSQRARVDPQGMPYDNLFPELYGPQDSSRQISHQDLSFPSQQDELQIHTEEYPAPTAVMQHSFDPSRNRPREFPTAASLPAVSQSATDWSGRFQLPGIDLDSPENAQKILDVSVSASKPSADEQGLMLSISRKPRGTDRIDYLDMLEP